MRDYGLIHSTFWTSETSSTFSDDARLLALYLLSSPHANALGCYRLTNGYVMDDLRWSMERVAKGFAELLRNGFANRCETTGWVLISKYLRWNPAENPNQVKSLARLAKQVPLNAAIADKLKSALDQFVTTHDRDAARELSEAKSRLSANPSETVPEPFRNQNQVQVQEQNQDQEQKKTDSAEPKIGSTPVAHVEQVGSEVLLGPKFIDLPLNTGKPHPVYRAQIDEWRKLYPAVDVEQALRSMVGWLKANPSKRKTRNGISRFVASWLAREQDRGGVRGGHGRAIAETAQRGTLRRGEFT